MAGRGKTYAAACLYINFKTTGFVLWCPASRVIRDLAKARVDGGEGSIRRSFQDAGFIVLDDVGTRAPTEPQLDALRDLLEWRGGRPMVVTGNLDPKKLGEVYDDRIMSRLCAGTVIKVIGNDMRLGGAISLEA